MSKTLLRHTLIKQIFLTFLLKPYLYTFSLGIWNSKISQKSKEAKRANWQWKNSKGTTI
jgi:hypothetical protein